MAFNARRLVCGGGEPFGRWEYGAGGPVLRHADQTVCKHRGAIREVPRDGTPAELAEALAAAFTETDAMARLLRGEPLFQVCGDIAEELAKQPPPRPGQRRCDNCGSPVAEHCGIHMIPCCPGKCPGPERTA